MGHLMPAFRINYTKADTTVSEFTGKSPFVLDVNSDGLDDFIAFGLVFPPAGPGFAPARLYIQQRDGTFVATLPLADGKELMTTLIPFNGAYFGDLNGDGVTDVFAAAMGWDAPPSSPPEQNRLLLGTKDGKFLDATSQLPQQLTNTHSYAAADLDRDGDIDFLIGNIDSRGPFVMLNDGKAGFTIANGWLPASLQNGSFRIAESEFFDLNNDGNLDLVVSPFFGPGKVFWGSADNKFSDQRVATLPTPAYSSQPLILSFDAVDFNNDGFQDLLVGGLKQYQQTGGIQILLNSGNGSFVDATEGFIAGTSLVKIDVYQLLWMDVNGDGARDIVRQNISILMEASEPVLWLNDGANRFTTVTAGDLGLTGTVYADWYIGPNGELRILSGLGEYQGSGFVNYFTPTAELKSVYAAAGPKNDQFVGKAGDQIYNGGKGLDTISYAALRSSVTVKSSTAGEVSVTDGTGVDRLISVERVRFQDGTLAFDTDGAAGQAYRVYKAAFDRTPDQAGLSFWIKQMDTGVSVRDVAQGFVGSQEFLTVYGQNSSNSDFLGRLYKNVLGRAGEVGGLAYWQGQLEKGVGRASVLADFSESAENIVGTSAAIKDGIWF